MYDEFYQLQDLPFRLSPDHRFFFSSDVHSRALAHLKFGLEQGEGFILVTGDVGAGKTTLIEHLLATLNTRKFIAANIVTTNLDQENLIRLIAGSFGLQHEGLSKASIIKNLEHFVADCMRQGRRCLLFVDEAQNLSIGALEELRMLSNLMVNSRPAIQSFLLGQPQFRKTLARPDLAQLRQRVIASYHLGPLSRGETGSYMEHRLNLVGWSGDPTITADAVDAIHYLAGGIPRRINTICTRIFLFAYLENAHKVDRQMVEEVAEEIERELGQVVDFEQQDHEPALLAHPVHSVQTEIKRRRFRGGSKKKTAECNVDEWQSHVELVPSMDEEHLVRVDEELMTQVDEDRLVQIDEERVGHSEFVEAPFPPCARVSEPVYDLTNPVGSTLPPTDLSTEAHNKLMRRALHMVVNYLGGRHRAS